MSLINVENLTFCYDGSFDNIFENVSFQIDTDWKIGFIGRNGKGKTTFLKLLMNEYEYRGKITASLEFDCFPFFIDDKSRNTIDIIEKIYPQYEFWMLCRELNLLCVSNDVLFRPFNTLSNGEQIKVMLAVLFIKENNFLLIDEPTNHLDLESREAVSNYLKRKKGFILVSHDRYFLDACIDHVISINNTNIEIQKGNFTSWQENKKLKDSFEIAENEKLKKDIKRLDEAAKKTSLWSDSLEKTKLGTRISGLRPDRGFIGHKSAKMMKRSKSIESRQQAAITEKSKLLKDLDFADSLKINPIYHHSCNIIEAENICLYYGKKLVCNSVSFCIQNGDRVSLHGKNGSGKSSIIKLIIGEDINYTGHLKIASRLKCSYASQDTSFLFGSLRDFADNNSIDESLFKAILRKLDFSRTQFEKNIKDYSEGQKKKVLIAKSLCEQANIYIWDEPLNFIDVLSRMQIEELILKYKPTMLFVEHDKVFTEKVATKVINL